jgi:hypothetical protein
MYEEGIRHVRDGRDWHVAMYRASETDVVDAEELLDARATMSEEEYDQEYECSFTAALIGSYYGKYLNELDKRGRIKDFDIDPNVAVSTYWDLGIGDTTAVWFIQRVGSEIRVIDYYENGGVGLEHYAKEIRNKPYVYEEHGLPHDGEARELGTGRTRQETLLDFGIRTHIIPRQAVDDGINAVRVLLGKNIYFHRTNCGRGLEALKNYQRKYDSKNQMFISKPLHNWASNGADAFRMLALDLRLPENRFNMNDIPAIVVQDYNELEF